MTEHTQRLSYSITIVLDKYFNLAEAPRDRLPANVGGMRNARKRGRPKCDFIGILATRATVRHISKDHNILKSISFFRVHTVHT
jgi:hypothetical protein